MFSPLLSSFAVTMVALQATSAPAPSSATPTDTKALVTLSGCVSQDGTFPSTFAFAESGTDTKYRLSGGGVQKYAGQRVEIVGAPVGRRLTFHFGLLPTPNVAAQAGALDPAEAAVASLPGGTNGGAGSVELPEFRVTRVRPLGSCR
jgi:hypothetical protein